MLESRCFKRLKVLKIARQAWSCIQQDSNLHYQGRNLPLCPLSYKCNVWEPSGHFVF